MQLCNHVSLNLSYFHKPQISLCIFSVGIASLFQLQEITHVLSVSTDLLFLVVSYKLNHWIYDLSCWPILFSITFLNFIHTVTRISSSFLFTTEQFSIVKHTPHFVHSNVWWFQFLQITHQNLIFQSFERHCHMYREKCRYIAL